MDTNKKKDESNRGLTQMDADKIPSVDSVDFICVNLRSSAVSFPFFAPLRLCVRFSFLFGGAARA
jgi:hypothetical protein